MCDTVRAAAEEGLRIDPSLPEPRAILAVCHDMEYEWTEADRHWRIALALEPVSNEIRLWYGNHHLLSIGRVEEAVDAIVPGVREDPLNHLYRVIFAIGLRHLGKLDEAVAELEKILEVDENYGTALYTLSAIRAQQGSFERTVLSFGGPAGSPETARP